MTEVHKLQDSQIIQWISLESECMQEFHVN